jgi:hypothetical protein
LCQRWSLGWATNPNRWARTMTSGVKASDAARAPKKENDSRTG